MSMKILIIGGLASSLVNFRGELIKQLATSNNQIVALAAPTDKKSVDEIEVLGCQFRPIYLSRNGLNPFVDIETLTSLYKIFRAEKPDIIISYTIKPVIWGGIAARFYGKAKFYGLITGLGFAFQKGGFRRNLIGGLAKFLYRIALAKSSGVIFQNLDNQQKFIDLGIVPEHKTAVVNGSGVDVTHFEINPLPAAPKFLLIARLLGDKGIREYVKAANIIKQHYPKAVFQLVGPEDPSPDGISLKELKKLNQNNSVNYLGATSDVRPFIEDCSIFVLPSYHEGLPRTVLEAMAMGRPILTTDVPGCRETVINGENGWLVDKANVEQLVDRMTWFIENPLEWQRMAEASRNMVENKFDVHKVNTELMNIMRLSK